MQHSRLGETWLVVGAGVSGLAAARFLRKRLGATVLLSDRNPLAAALAKELEALGIAVAIGPQEANLLDGVGRVVVSPGIAQTMPLLVEARRRGIPIVTEIDLALVHFDGVVVGITGTNGKSTTCVMTEHLLNQAGRRASAGGNLGDPPCAQISEGRVGDCLVLELSSYQLEVSEKIAADAAVFTSFSFDHMERHGSLEAYFRAKWRLIRALRPGGAAIMTRAIYDEAQRLGEPLPRECHLFLVDATPRSDGHVVRFEEILVEAGRQEKPASKRLALDSVGLQEHHNRLNAAFSLLAAAHVTGRSPEAMVSLLPGWKPLPYRFETVASWKGFPVINDSKSTNVESTLAALQSDYPQFILMLGGHGKGEPYTPLLAMKNKIKALICFGASGPSIAKELAELEPLSFSTLAAAMTELPQIFAKSPAPVLFSPACASFDEFRNFEHRGQFFTEKVKSLADRL